jgi:hypothetical protein
LFGLDGALVLRHVLGLAENLRRPLLDVGRALAEQFGVPFHFASPDRPDDDALRWRATS